MNILLGNSAVVFTHEYKHKQSDRYEKILVYISFDLLFCVLPGENFLSQILLGSRSRCRCNFINMHGNCAQYSLNMTCSLCTYSHQNLLQSPYSSTQLFDSDISKIHVMDILNKWTTSKTVLIDYTKYAYSRLVSSTLRKRNNALLYVLYYF